VHTDFLRSTAGLGLVTDEFLLWTMLEFELLEFAESSGRSRNRHSSGGRVSAHRTAEGADIVGCLRVASRLVGVSDFKVGHVDIDNAVHESEGIRRIVGTGAMDQRKAQAALNRVQKAL